MGVVGEVLVPGGCGGPERWVGRDRATTPGGLCRRGGWVPLGTFPRRVPVREHPTSRLVRAARVWVGASGPVCEAFRWTLSCLIHLAPSQRFRIEMGSRGWDWGGAAGVEALIGARVSFGMIHPHYTYATSGVVLAGFGTMADSWEVLIGQQATPFACMSC